MPARRLPQAGPRGTASGRIVTFRDIARIIPARAPEDVAAAAKGSTILVECWK